MKTVIIIFLTVVSFSAFAQGSKNLAIGSGKSDTTSTPINFGDKNMARFKQLDDQQKKVDSVINVQREDLLDVILSTHNIERKDVVKIEPKGNGNFIIKTKKK